VSRKLRVALEKAQIEPATAAAILADEQSFLAVLNRALAGDPYLHLLVDKNHSFEPKNYEPADLVELKNGAYRVNRAAITLRREAETALSAMAEAARSDGVVLLVSSAYRSYEYQIEVYARNVRENGMDIADRESARPGYSQHQTGLAVDFGSITDAFAETAAGKWILENAGRFGWSLSFPDGYETLTGYRWESWHYRYVGAPLILFINTYFGGIQQYALRFMYEWEHLNPEDYE
jgi:D-alanyl-D-alanine carboxypeptidase